MLHIFIYEVAHLLLEEVNLFSSLKEFPFKLFVLLRLWFQFLHNFESLAGDTLIKGNLLLQLLYLLHKRVLLHLSICPDLLYILVKDIVWRGHRSRMACFRRNVFNRGNSSFDYLIVSVSLPLDLNWGHLYLRRRNKLNVNNPVALNSNLDWFWFGNPKNLQVWQAHFLRLNLSQLNWNVLDDGFNFFRFRLLMKHLKVI